MPDWTPSSTSNEPATGRFGVDVTVDGRTTWGGRLLKLLGNTDSLVIEIYERLALTAVCTEILSGSVGLVPAPIALSRTFGGRSLSTADTEEEEFDVKNRRRIHLIERQLNTGLSHNESAELAALRASVVAAVNTDHPLPFDELEELERAARELVKGSD